MKRSGNVRGRTCLGPILGILLVTLAASALDAQMATLEERVAGADSVVVATPRAIAPEWRQNQFGDRLIVSRIQLEVHETMKGSSAPTVWLEVEGGTLDGFTLQVSSLPLIREGERAVFMLDATSRGVHVPHLRGMGILKLDEYNVVRGTNLRLDEIRSRVRGMGR